MKTTFIFSDIKSGIVVFLVALPLCLGISLACGVPLISGIISGVIGGIVVTIFSGAKYSVSGPAAGLTAIVLSAITDLGGYQFFIAAAIVAGLFQVVFGLIKAGTIGNYIPNSVIKGMLAGIGIILILKQLPHLVGYDADPEGDLYFEQSDGHNSISDLYYMLNYITPGSVIVGLVSVGILVMGNLPFYKKDKILSVIPAPLLAVTFGILLNLVFRSFPFLSIEAKHLVNLPKLESLQDLRTNIISPDFSLISHYKFWFVAFSLALVASIETLLSIEALEKLDPERTIVNPNKELLAQGIGNTLSGLIGGLPITSVIVRSSANIHAGARTKLSVIIHALLLLLSVRFIPEILCLIPNSCLAAILILTGYKLANLKLFTGEYRHGWDQFIPFAVTIVVMLLTDLLKGVGAGLMVSVFFIIRFNIKSSFEVIEQVIEGQLNYMIRLPQHATFFNKGFIIDYLNNIKENSRVIIDGSINRSTDKDVNEVLQNFIETARLKNIKIQLIKYSIKDHIE